MPAAYFYSSTAGSYTTTASLTSGATSVPLNSVTGLPGSLPYKVVIDPGTASEEIVKVTAIAGTTLTVTRGWDGTTAVAHNNAVTVRHMMTAEDLTLSRTHEAATAAHGVTGNIVGTSDVQVLTNKDLSGAGNTFPTSLATLTGTQALTNKDLTGVGNTFPTSLATLTGTQALTNKDLTGVGNTFPTSLATLTGTQTLSNKTLASPTMTGTTTSAGITSSGNITAPNLPASSSAVAGKHIHWGVYSFTTNGTGAATITHGAGFTPSGGAGTVLTPIGSLVLTSVNTITATQATLQFWFINGTSTANNQTISVFIVWGE